MTTWEILTSTWAWDPSIIVGCIILTGLYLVATNFRFTYKTVLFITGVLVIFLALESPLEALGDAYLFSAHMFQHLLLILLVPPLLLLGMPRRLTGLILDWAPARQVEQFLGQGLVAWLVGTVTVWLWHLPWLYNATLLNEQIHILEHLSFLVTATIFWWPVLNPLAKRRLPALVAIPYLFAAAASSSVLGIILTFAPVGLYPAYLQPVDTLGILPLLRHQWGLTPEIDQQVGGLLMWVPGSLVFLSGIIGALARWYNEPEEDRGQVFASQ